MSKINLICKVSQTSYYDNSGDEGRSYDVSARVTLSADSSVPAINEGYVRPIGGDVVLATFSVPAHDGGMGGSMVPTITYPGTINTTLVRNATADICNFIDAFTEAPEETQEA
ncbi:MAG: hypothetical protein OSJ25_06925 [Paramuribaculum sp.]|uniref:hypothetical protein n=1 Tax=Muribaculum intestinale TaxID=1796646 RepID=UPI0025B75DEB|nr:hypothetical protein [Muribaculum intestinale]MCX4333165.1 hypothetical protein [Paramuribaculum sp.]